MSYKAEILDADMIEVPDNNYNPNQTKQVMNLVQISPTINVGENVNIHRDSKFQKDTIKSILALYNNIAQENGFEVKWNIDDIQKNFDEIIDDNKEQLFRISLSKAFGKFQLVFYQRAMNTVMALMDQISSPSVINDSSISIEWKYAMINQLLGLMNTVSDLYERVKVQNPEYELRKLSKEKTSEDNDLRQIRMSKQSVAIMKELKSISLQYKNGQQKTE